MDQLLCLDGHYFPCAFRSHISGGFVSFFVSVLLISIWLGVAVASKWANEKFQEIGCLFFFSVSLDEGRYISHGFSFPRRPTLVLRATPTSKTRIYRLLLFSWSWGWLCLSLLAVFVESGHRLATQHNSPHQTTVYCIQRGVWDRRSHQFFWSFFWTVGEVGAAAILRGWESSWTGVESAYIFDIFFLDREARRLRIPE
ncbi:hypothetical protein B0T18DRAFT_190361 [Schizothecium vesticola]|uniref:Uncharacterized protein n=1 Tax=Schizothecium vesticola TaxID=314040 RepID=A0AA40K2Q3_9PEZI|nr:hypothetical protein B0T18DRAFT_190361 [Schizothecium vesticola]